MELLAQQAPAVKIELLDETMVDDSEESRALHNRSDAAALFGQGESHLSVAKVSFMETSSPMMKPSTIEFDMLANRTEMQDIRVTDDLSSFICENVDMDELDDLFMNY
jgi:hypothetical protein